MLPSVECHDENSFTRTEIHTFPSIDNQGTVNDVKKEDEKE